MKDNKVKLVEHKTFTKKELLLIKKLNTPAKIQDFLNNLSFNFEESGIETLKSPLLVLRTGNAHCFEGALLGAYILSTHDYPPLVMYHLPTKDDVAHAVALFKKDGLWGALSKTNHSVLRYREPVYKTIRELTMSYFHEYFIASGKKTLRQYSKPLNLNIFKNKNWPTSSEDLWYIDKKLDSIKHYDVAPKKTIKNFRKADKIELDVVKIVEYKKPKPKKICKQ